MSAILKNEKFYIPNVNILHLLEYKWHHAKFKPLLYTCCNKEFVLRQLKKGSVYDVVGFAKNKYGWSDHSKTFTFFNKGVGEFAIHYFFHSPNLCLSSCLSLSLSINPRIYCTPQTRKYV